MEAIVSIKKFEPKPLVSICIKITKAQLQEYLDKPNYFYVVEDICCIHCELYLMHDCVNYPYSLCMACEIVISQDYSCFEDVMDYCEYCEKDTTHKRIYEVKLICVLFLIEICIKNK